MGRTVCLVHHGDAEPPDIDPQRPLSAAGRAQVEELARRAAARGVRPACIWHSGKLRARQTAESFWRACNPLAELTAIRGLQPADPPADIVDRLAGETRDIVLVGHLPNLARVLRLLTAGDVDADLTFPPHGNVVIEQEDDRWMERWRTESEPEH